MFDDWLPFAIYGFFALVIPASMVFMGANGAGKSTLVKILTGAVRPDGGTIAVRGHERTVHSPGEARRGGLVSVYQEPALIPDLDIRSNLRLTRTPVEPFRHWLAELGLEKLDLSNMTRCPGVSSAGIGIPGLYDPATGCTRFLVNIPGACIDGNHARRTCPCRLRAETLTRAVALTTMLLS